MVPRVVASAATVGRQEGQALVEYVLILGLISIVTVALMAAVGTSVTDLLSRVSDRLVSAV
jgi:Flp pilus assembly pilin Flp